MHLWGLCPQRILPSPACCLNQSPCRVGAGTIHHPHHRLLPAGRVGVVCSLVQSPFGRRRSKNGDRRCCHERQQSQKRH